MAQRNLAQHGLAIVLGLAVAAIFVAALVVFQVRENDLVIVTRFGKPLTERAADGGERVRIYAPGAHFKLPLVEEVWRHDNRLQCYELRKGQVEQIQTADDYQVIVTTFVLWRVGDPVTFLKAVNTTAEAENKLDDLVRNARNNVLGRHTLGELINTDAAKVQIPKIESEILAELDGVSMQKYGIKATFVGFKHIGFPEEVTSKVFDRMRAERQRRSDAYRAEGARDAQKIRAQADLTVSEMLSMAEAEAMQIRAEGDKTAAEAYAVFRKDPQLAAFLRKLEALRQAVSDKTTLVLDTQTPPYDLLLPGATKLRAGPVARPAAGNPGPTTPETK